MSVLARWGKSDGDPNRARHPWLVVDDKDLNPGRRGVMLSRRSRGGEWFSAVNVREFSHARRGFISKHSACYVYRTYRAPAIVKYLSFAHSSVAVLQPTFPPSSKQLPDGSSFNISSWGAEPLGLHSLGALEGGRGGCTTADWILSDSEYLELWKSLPARWHLVRFSNWLEGFVPPNPLHKSRLGNLARWHPDTLEPVWRTQYMDGQGADQEKDKKVARYCLEF